MYNQQTPDKVQSVLQKKKVIMKHFRARKYAKVYLADYGKSSDHYTL